MTGDTDLGPEPHQAYPFFREVDDTNIPEIQKHIVSLTYLPRLCHVREQYLMLHNLLQRIMPSEPVMRANFANQIQQARSSLREVHQTMFLPCHTDCKKLQEQNRKGLRPTVPVMLDSKHRMVAAVHRDYTPPKEDVSKRSGMATKLFTVRRKVTF